MPPVAVAVAQFAAGPDPDANLATIADLLPAAGDAQLVVLPEYALAFDPAGDQRGFAQPLDGPFVRGLADLAGAHSVTIVAGVTEATDEDRVFNTVVTVDPDGELRATYRKVHLYNAFGYREADQLRAATIEAPQTWTLGGLRLGVLTCYDLRFPESARWLTDHGVDVLVVPAAWIAGPLKEDHWTTLLRARAIENTAFVIAAGQTGPACCGGSLILDPMGVVLAAGGEAPGVVRATLDPARLAAVRSRNPAVANRRFAVTPRD